MASSGLGKGIEPKSSVSSFKGKEGTAGGVPFSFASKFSSQPPPFSSGFNIQVTTGSGSGFAPNFPLSNGVGPLDFSAPKGTIFQTSAKASSSSLHQQPVRPKTATSFQSAPSLPQPVESSAFNFALSSNPFPATTNPFEKSSAPDPATSDSLAPSTETTAAVPSPPKFNPAPSVPPKRVLIDEPIFVDAALIGRPVRKPRGLGKKKVSLAHPSAPHPSTHAANTPSHSQYPTNFQGPISSSSNQFSSTSHAANEHYNDPVQVENSMEDQPGSREATTDTPPGKTMTNSDSDGDQDHLEWKHSQFQLGYTSQDLKDYTVRFIGDEGDEVFLEPEPDFERQTIEEAETDLREVEHGIGGDDYPGRRHEDHQLVANLKLWIFLFYRQAISDLSQMVKDVENERDKLRDENAAAGQDRTQTTPGLSTTDIQDTIPAEKSQGRSEEQDASLNSAVAPKTMQQSRDTHAVDTPLVPVDNTTTEVKVESTPIQIDIEDTDIIDGVNSEKPPRNQDQAIESQSEEVLRLQEEALKKDNLITRLQGEAQSQKKLATRLQSVSRTMARTLRRFQGEIVNNKNVIARLQGEVLNKNSLITTLQGDITRRDNFITTLQGNITGKDSIISTLEGDAATNQTQTASLEGNLECANSQVSKIEAKLTLAINKVYYKGERNNYISDSANRIEELQISVNKLTDEIKKNREAKSLTPEAPDKTEDTELAKAIVEMENLRLPNEKHHSEISTLNQSLETQNKELAGKVSTLQSKIENFEIGASILKDLIAVKDRRLERFASTALRQAQEQDASKFTQEQVPDHQSVPVSNFDPRRNNPFNMRRVLPEVPSVSPKTENEILKEDNRVLREQCFSACSEVAKLKQQMIPPTSWDLVEENDLVIPEKQSIISKWGLVILMCLLAFFGAITLGLYQVTRWVVTSSYSLCQKTYVSSKESKVNTLYINILSTVISSIRATAQQAVAKYVMKPFKQARLLLGSKGPRNIFLLFVMVILIMLFWGRILVGVYLCLNVISTLVCVLFLALFTLIFRTLICWIWSKLSKREMD